ncbi:cupin domain-containing protein [Nocardia sp. NBC_00508]|uniref:cupin domain-containing protein n=1 Tax=Nocardia sp. NBC_00508 TaxID=2975992 RepID=UPI002E823236|nr:cupin domain-containing protein [Nocardia sp. NBC_00508]WUD64046.1 cupin domain-containing protein [Nocardia sp. NBC_00508]
MIPDELSDSPVHGAIPPDDPRRQLTVADANSGAGLRHLALAGNVYSILIPGSATNGRYTLIEMRVPPGGGPPPHRHDVEEMFTVLEGSIRFTFRGLDIDVVAGTTVNIPANAPHFFRNVSDRPARMLCMCAPAGQEEYFAEVGAPLDSPTDSPPPLTEAEESQQREKARRLAAKYRSELL